MEQSLEGGKKANSMDLWRKCHLAHRKACIWWTLTMLQEMQRHHCDQSRVMSKARGTKEETQEAV